VADYFQHSHQAPPLVEQTPPTLRPATRSTLAARLVVLVGRPLWLWRVELTSAALLLAAWRLLAGSVGRVGATLLLAAVGVLVIAGPAGLRARVWLVFHRASVRRGWVLAVRHAGLATHNDRTPRAVRIQPTLAGDRLRVRVPAGSRTAELADAAETLAACLEAREVRVVRDPDNARYASVTIVRRDPLATTRPLGWPNLAAARLSLWEPIPVGIDEDGAWVLVQLPERNVLIGGEPGGGKSVALSLLVATAALDPEVILVTLDGKLVELASWAAWRPARSAPTWQRRSRSFAASRASWTGGFGCWWQAGAARCVVVTGCHWSWWSSTSWPTTSTALTAGRTRSSPTCSATWSRGAAPQGSSSWRPRRSQVPT